MEKCTWKDPCNCGLQKGSDPARNELSCVRQVGWLQGSEWEGISDGQRTARCVLLSQGAANCSQSAADLGPPLGEGALGTPLQPGATEPLVLRGVHKPERGRATFSPFKKCLSVFWRLHTPFFSTFYREEQREEALAVKLLAPVAHHHQPADPCSWVQGMRGLGFSGVLFYFPSQSQGNLLATHRRTTSFLRDLFCVTE